MRRLLTYALDKNGNLVHINDVANGIKCACSCPRCRKPLYAKNKGLYRQHHFAHAGNHECLGAFESQLHLLAKEVLQETGRIMLPLTYSDRFPSGSVKIRNIEIEKRDELYNIQPYVEGIMDNGERLLIEFYVSNKVSDNKRQVIVDNNLRCIEIDINYQVLHKKELKEFLCNSEKDRKWIVSQLSSSKITDDSKSSERNPMYNKTRDIIKEYFDKGTLYIYPHYREKFDLRQYGYDVCEVDTVFQGFKSDLLLYRSQKENKGYISINIRGRSRDIDFSYPKELRIIDVVFKAISPDEDGIRRRIKDGDLQGDLGMFIEYRGRFINK